MRRGVLRGLRSVYLQVDGCRLHARVATAAPGAPAVVLVHGWGVSGSYFIPAAERLAAEFAVYAPDLPGHGRSETPAWPLDVAGLAQALIHWMDAVGIERAALVGHSLGCQVAVEAALQAPARVDRLVLVGPTVDPSARSALRQSARLLAAAVFERPSLVIAHIVPDYLRMGPRLLPEFRAMLRDRVDAKLPVLTVPVMLVRGGNDAIVPRAWLDQAARLARAERVAVIPWRGHAVQYSAPARLVDAIRPFLQEAASSRRLC
jgi:2-hydroxy-6-oxonona-2,4-dienedioate hydrolase